MDVTNPQLNRIGILPDGNLAVGIKDLKMRRVGVLELSPKASLALGQALIFKALMSEVLLELAEQGDQLDAG